MAQEGGGMTVSKLVVIIMALLLLVLIAVGAYNGWLVNGIQKMGSQMDKILIFFNQKGETTNEELCLDKIDVTIKDKIKGSLEICPNQCELTLNEKIDTSSKFKINTTGTYKYLEATGVGESNIEETESTLKEGWNLIEKINSEEIKKEVEASENFNILLNTLKNFLKEINPETIEEFENVCNSNEECPTGYYCDSPQNPFFCPENPFKESSLNSQEVLILKEEIIYDGTKNDIFLDSKGDLYFIITENYKKDPLSKLKIGEYSYYNKLKIYNDIELENENSEIHKWSVLMTRGKDKKNKLLKIEPCYFEGLNNLLINLYFKNYPYSNHYENPYINKNQQEYYCKKIETTPQLNRIFHTTERYYVFIADSDYNSNKQKIGTLIYQQGEKWFQGEIRANEELKFDKLKNGWWIFSQEITNTIDAVTQIRKISNDKYNVYHGPITDSILKRTQYLNYDFGKLNRENQQEFYNYLIANLTENGVQTQKIKQEFNYYLKDLSNEEQKIDLINLEDGRIMLTIKDKYGITKNENRDVLEIDFPDLKMFELKNRVWEEIDIEDKSYFMNDSEIEELKNQKEDTNSIIDYLNERCW